MTKLNIAFAPDDGYMNMTIVSMFSALQNNIDSEVEFIILYSKLSDTSWEKLKNFEKLFKNVLTNMRNGIIVLSK